MKLKPFTKNNILSVVSSLILFASVPVVLAWTAPTATPPNANVPAPVNVGLNYQIKQGKLGLFGNDTALRVSKVDSYTPTNVPLLSTLLVGVNGKVGAAQYCDERGENCTTIQQLKSALGI